MKLFLTIFLTASLSTIFTIALTLGAVDGGPEQQARITEMMPKTQKEIDKACKKHGEYYVEMNGQLTKLLCI